MPDPGTTDNEADFVTATMQNGLAFLASFSDEAGEAGNSASADARIATVHFFVLLADSRSKRRPYPLNFMTEIHRNLAAIKEGFFVSRIASGQLGGLSLASV